MRSSIRLGSLLGVPIYLHFTFLLLLGVLSLSRLFSAGVAAAVGSLILAIDERHAVIRTEVVDREDVGVRQRRDCLGLAFEPGEVLGVLGHLARQHLDRNLTIEFGVDCTPNLTHAAFADLLDDSVMQ